MRALWSWTKWLILLEWLPSKKKDMKSITISFYYRVSQKNLGQNGLLTGF